MRAVLAFMILLATHALFFGDVLLGGRSLWRAPYAIRPPGVSSVAPATESLDLPGTEPVAAVDERSAYLAAATWRAGEVPLWTPAVGLGAPLAATLRSGVLNPLQIPLALWPGPRSADLYCLARILILAFGTYLYLGELTLMLPAALLGAFVVAYGGHTMGQIAAHALSAEIYLPFMLVGVERGRRGMQGGWAMLALACAGSCLGGEPRATLACILLVAIYAAVRAPRRSGGAGSRTLAAVSAAVVTGVALAAYLLLPAAEIMARGSPLDGQAMRAAVTLPWRTLAAIALPQLFLPGGRFLSDGAPLPPAIGVVATVIVGLGVSAWSSPVRGVARVFFWAGALVLLREAGILGRGWMTRIPVGYAVLPFECTFIAAFALAVLAAIGLDALARGLLPHGAVWGASVATFGVLLVLIGAAAVGGPQAGWPSAGATVHIALASVVVLLAASSRHRASGGALALLLCAAALLELLAFAPASREQRSDPPRAPAYVEFLRNAGGRILADPALMPPLDAAAWGVRALGAIDVRSPEMTAAFFARLVGFPSRVGSLADIDLPVAATAPAIDLAGVRWVVSRGPLALDDLDARVARQVGVAADEPRRSAAVARHRREREALVAVFHDDLVDATVYENRNALPRAFRVPRIEPPAGAETVLTRLADGFDFRDAALVEEHDAVEEADMRLAGAPARREAVVETGAGVDKIMMVKDDPNAVTIATDGPEDGLLVLADLAYPGWHAAIDGRPSPILTTDGVLRGVRLPRGPHCVEFRYLPAAWAWGGAASALALALLPALVRHAGRAHRKIVPAFPAMV